jgi:hypothetical protein
VRRSSTSTRKEYVQNYILKNMLKNINRDTHTIMRRFDDQKCDPNPLVEMAKVAAVFCMHHHCIQTAGGGDKDGNGCRFDMPKKNLNHTITAVLTVKPCSASVPSSSNLRTRTESQLLLADLFGERTTTSPFSSTAHTR